MFWNHKKVRLSSYIRYSTIVFEQHVELTGVSVIPRLTSDSITGCTLL